MAAMSAVSGTATLTTTSSHANHSRWNHTSSGSHDSSTSHKLSADKHETNGSMRGPSYIANGDAGYDPYATDDYLPSKGQNKSTSDHKRPNADVSPSEPDDDEHSKWIHRDKLARIENQELQAAGIVLPKPRAHSRPRRDRSPDKANGRRRGTDASERPVARSRKNSELSLEIFNDIESPDWDLRLPEEIAEDPGEYWVRSDTSKSRIPVAKISPAPIPVDYLERDAPAVRKPGFPMPDQDPSISLPKSRSRSGSSNALDNVSKTQPTKRAVKEGSPKKTSTGARKGTAPTKTTSQGRPKTRSGQTPRNGSTTRPTTRSGELSPSVTKSAPEGDPPWMISAYKPDPRLPPDQQLLPTVAKRLQQEKWEQEGKFGNIYDKEFRPLNDEGFLKPPEVEKPKETEEGQQGEWPLRPGAKSPNNTSRPGTSSYSTMPKIQGTPAASPLASPRSVQQPQIQATQNPRVPTEVEEPEEEKPNKSGCGCCVVM
ncbi:hypothetical protein F5Y00DRAFT_254133 [Daldinia vernicosa]|uniref:uncharacterized protein n=1 Tax=Daldinia vernicosa TaxID=114800 RepID=UPI002008181F|nr:uncharacterized protein F5Y00DRAFT_254133 [Daldinia vernicosa]KAI0847216.1 hypothetical protein F5Y00DRAFT_254133 [Daldinia vernicosa]